jgi:hypothetical protein
MIRGLLQAITSTEQSLTQISRATVEELLNEYKACEGADYMSYVGVHPSYKTINPHVCFREHRAQRMRHEWFGILTRSCSYPMLCIMICNDIPESKIPAKRMGDVRKQVF